MLPLSNFESGINPTILYRGEEYYNEDLVSDLNETAPGEWEATVHGTECYTVEISIENNNITDWYCDCPYDGIVCKHVVATLYAIRNESKKISKFAFSDAEVEEVNMIDSSSLDITLSGILRQANPSEIITFIAEYAETDARFKEKLIDKFIPKPNNDHLTVDFHKEIEACFLSGRGRRSGKRRYYDGFESEIDYQETASRLLKVLGKARILIASQALGDAVSIAIQVLKSIADNYDEGEYNYYEDDGALSHVCGIAEEIITEVARHSETTPELRKSTLDAIIPLTEEDAFCEGIYDLEDLVYDLNIYARTPEELLEYLNQRVEDSTNPYERTRYVIEKIDLLTEMNCSDEAIETTLQYIDIPDVRAKEIQRLICLKEYDNALLLANEGITISNEQNAEYLIKRWKNTKLGIYQITNNVNEMTATAREIFILESGSMEMYHLLKKHIATSQWTFYLAEMMQATKFHPYTYVELDIYVEEKAYDKLMAKVVQASGRDLSCANRYLPHLKDHYPEELIQLYETWIIEYAEQNVGRNHYEHVAAELKNMKKIKGGAKAVQTIIDTFKVIYKSRRAMMEVLAKVY